MAGVREEGRLRLPIEEDDEGYTKDGTVNLKGRPILRAHTGRWRACYFILGFAVFERIAYYGVASSLVSYLTDEVGEGTVKSANNVTNWVGTIWMTPLVGAYVADALLGRYWTFLIAASLYMAGLCTLTLAVLLRDWRSHMGLFYTGLYVTALGVGGVKPNISAMGGDQFDDLDPRERSQKLSFFNWLMFSIFYGTLFANTVLVYVQDTVSWGLGYGLATLSLLVSLIIFLEGTAFYRHKQPSESPFTRMLRVLVAALRKRNIPLPVDPALLYELSPDTYSLYGKLPIQHSSSLSFLDRASVRDGACTSPWRLCAVTQVEETKQMIKMIPIFVATLIPSTMYGQVMTLFIRQGSTLDRRLGGSGFTIPAASLTAFVSSFTLVGIVLYDRHLVPAVRRYTGNPRGISLLQRMGVGMVLHIIIMLAACAAERKRLSVVERRSLYDQTDRPVPLSIFILLPQFILMGFADTFVEVAKLEFFYDQAPPAMKTMGTTYFTTGIAVGNYLSTILLKTIAALSRRGGHEWLLDNLNVSHLDYVYALYALLSTLNFVFFLIVSRSYVYNVEPPHSTLKPTPPTT